MARGNDQLAPRRPGHRGGHRQRGVAFLILLSILAVLVGALVIGLTSSMARENLQQQETTDSLALAKDALIGWSASRTPTGSLPNARPGELPCPDTDNDGFENGTCSAGAIGRVPWKTLGLQEPTDRTGETLWYSLSGPFRIYSMSSAPITSDTWGTMTVYLDSSATVVTSQAIAVLFAPGPAIGAQNRNASTTAFCSTTGTTIPRNRCAANYLESTGGGNNAQTGGPFIQAGASDTFNDRLLAITNADLMPIVEQRVAREVMALMQAYKAATATSLQALFSGGVYPWADVSDGDSNNGTNRGRFPCGTATPVDWGSPVPLSLSGQSAPALPNWLTNGCGSDGWADVIYYSIGRDDLYLDIVNGLFCTTCTASSLSVDGAAGHELVLMTPGAAGAGRTWVPGYFEDAENSDHNDDNYISPTSTSYNRDRIYSIP